MYSLCLMVDGRRAVVAKSDPLADQYSDDLPEDDGNDDAILCLCFFSIISFVLKAVAKSLRHLRILTKFPATGI